MSSRELITEHLDLWTGAVTKKSSSGHGGNVKVELTGIKKLRELILELAMSGKLVEQDAEDEPAQELIAKLSAAKTKLNREGILKNSRKLPDISDEDTRTPLPSGWFLTRLGDAYDVRDGTHDSPKYQSSGYPLITSKNLSSGELSFDDVKFISESDHQKIQERSRVRKGDILFAMIGSIGNPVIVNTDRQFSIKNVALFKYYSNQLSNPSFLKLFLENAAENLKQQAAGGVQSFVSLGKLRNWLIPLPPMAEQHRIVQKVDELMALCDRLEQQTGDQLEAHKTLVDTLLDTLTQSENATELADNWARVAANFDTLFTTEQSIDKLKQTVLRLAVMGRLVEQNAGDEPTTQLLDRISSEKQRLVKSKVLKRMTSTAPLDTSALPSIPESWSWVNLGDIISVMDAGWSPACPPGPAAPETWGVLKTTAVQVMNYQELENKQLPDNKAPKEQYEVRSGDILITRAGPKNRVGISCVVKETRDKLMISDKIIRLHLIEAGLSEEYICLCLNAGETYSYLEQAKSGMAESQMNISQDKLKAAPVPLCPANEQHRIIQKVDELMALCDRLKERLKKASETRCQMAEGIVEQGLSA